MRLCIVTLHANQRRVWVWKGAEASGESFLIAGAALEHGSSALCFLPHTIEQPHLILRSCIFTPTNPPYPLPTHISPHTVDRTNIAKNLTLDTRDVALINTLIIPMTANAYAQEQPSAPSFMYAAKRRICGCPSICNHLFKVSTKGDSPCLHTLLPDARFPCASPRLFDLQTQARHHLSLAQHPWGRNHLSLIADRLHECWKDKKAIRLAGTGIIKSKRGRL
jgi:hypothetical protein